MKKMYLALTVFAVGMSQLMAQFSGGDGSIGDPYQITTKMDLKELIENDIYWAQNFIQTDDLVFNALDFDEFIGDFFWPSGFKTIGTVIIPFIGTYEGNNHTISNLEMYSNQSRLGLFGYTSGATISNLGLLDIVVNGNNDYNGAIIGDAYNTTLTNCYSSGTVHGYYYAGGLIGYTFECELTDCYSSAVVSVDEEYAGGLVGYDDVSVFTNCYAIGNVVSYYRYAGGLLGYAENSELTDCYATGNVSVDYSYAGGLIGDAYYSELTDCNATGNVVGEEYVGGLIGRAYDLTITDCYATGDIEGVWNYSGGLLAYIGNSTITNCYAEGNVIGGYATGGLIGYSEDDVISFCNASGEVTASSYYTGGLIGEASLSTISNSFATGNVTTEDYYTGGLIGYSGSTNVSESYATGDVTSTNEGAGGLIGYVNSGNIIDCYATGNVSGDYEVGGLIGYVYYGNISESNATGSVEALGDYSAGGLIGEAYFATIEECYATGSVVGLDYVGGLVGYTYDVEIFNSYAIGDVSGNNDYVGGLIGYLDFSQITNSYSVGSVTGPGDIGGLIGFNGGSSIFNSFYDEETSGQNDNDGRGVPRSTVDMKTESTFTDVSWDFTAIWQMDLGCPNDGYPIFVSQATQVKTVDPIPASASQDFCENSQIADLDITGDNIKWYDQANDGDLLDESTMLTDATSYFATQTIDGCESERVEVMVVINATPILDAVSNLSECDNYVLPVLTVGDYYTATNAGGTQLNDGDVITDSQTIFVYAENAGCPAESSFDLTIIELPLNTVTTATNGTLSADEVVAAYQWIDCDNMNSPISGAVNQFFIPTSSGNYSVEITKNGCSITSDCTPITISNVGFDENSLNQIAVYPNPSNGEFTVNLGDINDATIVVRDLAGKEVYRSHTTSSIVEVQLLEATGIYFLEVLTASNSKTIKIVKH